MLWKECNFFELSAAYLEHYSSTIARLSNMSCCSYNPLPKSEIVILIYNPTAHTSAYHLLEGLCTEYMDHCNKPE